MSFSSAFSDKIGLVFIITLRTWYLIFLWWFHKILRYIFQRMLEPTACHDRTASKFASHAHKGVKWRRGFSFYSGTSYLKHCLKRDWINFLHSWQLATPSKWVGRQPACLEPLGTVCYFDSSSAILKIEWREEGRNLLRMPSGFCVLSLGVTSV